MEEQGRNQAQPQVVGKVVGLGEVAAAFDVSENIIRPSQTKVRAHELAGKQEGGQQTAD